MVVIDAPTTCTRQQLHSGKESQLRRLHRLRRELGPEGEDLLNEQALYLIGWAILNCLLSLREP